MALRGGNWNNGADAGVFALNLNNLRSNTNTNIGFRPALFARVFLERV
jgi:RNA-directed DNA polymerase